MGDEADAIIDRMISIPTRREVVHHVVNQTRCGTTDLLVDQCGCRVHRGRPAPPDPFQSAEDKGPWFPASWGSECDVCSLPYDEGDEIRADGNGGWEGKCCADG